MSQQSDPIMDELRRQRLAIEKECGSRDAYFQMLKRTERELADRLVTRKPRRWPGERPEGAENPVS